MGTKEIIAAATDPIFYTRVAFIALRAAQNVASEAGDTPNHVNRVKYANLVFLGSDSIISLTLHIAASNATIAAALEAAGGDSVPDGDIEYAMGSIWDARSNAFDS